MSDSGAGDEYMNETKTNKLTAIPLIRLIITIRVSITHPVM